MLIAIILFTISTVQIVINLAKTLMSKNLIDFMVYWGASDKLFSGKNPYQFLYNGIPFNYPISSLIIYPLFKLFPIKFAQILLIVLSFLSLWVTLWIVIKLSKIKISKAHFLIILAFFNQTFPVKFTLVLGQINLIVLGLSFLGLYVYRKAIEPPRLRKPTLRRLGKPRRLIGTMLIAISAALKLFPLALLPLFFILKDFYFVFSVLFLFLLLNIAPSFSLFQQYYFKILPAMSQNISKPWFYDQSLTAFLMRLTNNPLLSKYCVLGIVAIIIIIIFIKFYKNKSLLLAFCLIFALISIGNIFSWQHHLVFSYPLILLTYIKLKNKFNLLIIKCSVFTIWFLLAFHFQNELSPLLSNPFIASYQTILIFTLIIINLLII